MVFTGFNVVGTYWSALCATQRGWAAGTSWQWKAGTWKKFAAARNKKFSHIFVEFQRSYVSHNFTVNQYFKVFNWSCERHDAEALPASHSQRRMCRTPHQSHLEPRQQSKTVDFLSLWFHRSTTLCWTCSELVQFIFCWWMHWHHWQERQERNVFFLRRWIRKHYPECPAFRGRRWCLTAMAQMTKKCWLAASEWVDEVLRICKTL